MARINELDQRILAGISGADRIRALLEEQGLTLRGFAGRYGEEASNVSRCISGQRPLPRIRNKLARRLRMKRAEIDEMIDGASEKRHPNGKRNGR